MCWKLDIENDTDMTERSEKYEKLMKDFNTIFRIGIVIVVVHNFQTY